MIDQVKIGVVGAAGRMGQALIAAIVENPKTVLTAALERDGASTIGQPASLIAPDVIISNDAEAVIASCDAILDFTTPAATVSFAAHAATHSTAHIIGTTGCDATHESVIAEAARHTAIVKSGNMSMGVILLSVLVEQASRALEAADWDIEVLEMHHKHKVDAPSGTALLLGEAAAKGRAITLNDHSVRVRDGYTGARDDGTIGFATLRGGSVVGDHSVIMAGAGERLTLSHHAEDRTIFARGAVKAAIWAHNKKTPGFYSMHDVLGLT